MGKLQVSDKRMPVIMSRMEFFGVCKVDMSPFDI